MYSAIYLLAILLRYCTTHAHAFPALANPTSPVPLTSLNLNATFTLTTIQQKQQNTTHSSSNFIGVECYHLLPDTVNLISCQPLFARLLQGGRAYEEITFRNGFRCLDSIDPCVITVSSPDRRHDHTVRISIAELVVFATEVLETCKENETGGANVFRGNWRVVVTKYPVNPEVE